MTGTPKQLSQMQTDRVRQALLDSAQPIRGEPALVLVLLSASRSGSSTVHDLLARCAGVAALPGEVEPYLRLTGNVQGSDGSNAVSSFQRLAELRALVRGDLRLWAQPKPLVYGGAWHRRRMLMQAPTGCLLDAGWYDGALSAPVTDLPVLEEPPLVPLEDAVVPETLEGTTVLLKTPQLVYRRGIVEQLFPHSRVRYLHLCRSAAGTVNGLLDGWLGPHFWSYNLRAPSGAPLPDWWCFDIPPCWQEADTLLDACVMQWLAANDAAMRHGIHARFHYEHVWRDGAAAHIAGLAGVQPSASFRTVMATDKPTPRRWARKRPNLASLMGNQRVAEMMDSLGYAPGGVEW